MDRDLDAEEKYTKRSERKMKAASRSRSRSRRISYPTTNRTLPLQKASREDNPEEHIIPKALVEPGCSQYVGQCPGRFKQTKLPHVIKRCRDSGDRSLGYFV